MNDQFIAVMREAHKPLCELHDEIGMSVELEAKFHRDGVQFGMAIGHLWQYPYLTWKEIADEDYLRAILRRSYEDLAMRFKQRHASEAAA